MILVDQPTEDLATLDRLGPRWARGWDRPPDIVRTTKTEPSVRSMRVVMRGVLTQDVQRVSSVKDQHVIEDLPPQASDESLRVTVDLWGPTGGEHDLDAFGGEDGIEAATVLGVAVAEQEAHAELGVALQIHHQVARLLGDPGPVRVGAHPDPEDPPRPDVHEHQHVQGLEQHRFDAEEVAGDDAFGLRREELMPGRTV